MSQSQLQHPTHRAYVTVGYGKDQSDTYWKEIGAAWMHSDGKGFALILDMIPMNRRITIRKSVPKKQGRISQDVE